jgi:HK97 family phage prohead protease
MLIKNFPVSVKGAVENEKIFEGYAATFDRVPDSYGDIIAKGAFTRTLEAHKDRRIPLLFGHVMDDPDYNIGYVDAEEDEHGLRVLGHIFMDTPKGKTVYNLLKRGQVYQMSFAFDVRDEKSITLEDGTHANELRELDLFECSVVTVPANQNATIDEVKSRKEEPMDEEKLNELLDELKKVSGRLTDLIDKVSEAVGAEEQTVDDSEGEEPEGEPDTVSLDEKKKAILKILGD